MSDVYLWETCEKVGRDALERRDFGQAVESFKAAVTVAEKLPGEELKLVMSLRHLAGATSKAGQTSVAFDLLRRTEEIAGERLGSSHSETVQVKRELYDLSRQLGHLDQAEGYLVEVLAVVRAHGETEEFLEILELLAKLAGERERPGDAALLYKEIVEARTTLYGEEHPSVAQALLWYSTALSRSGQGEAAEPPLSRAFGLLEKQFADDPQNLAQSLLAGGELMAGSGRQEAALEHQKRALDLLTGVLDENHQSLWDAREMIASTLASMGLLNESIELLEYCLQHRRGVRDHRTGALLKNLAGLYLSTQRPERAEELYRQASETLHQTLGADHPAYLATLEERIQLYHFTGRSQEALDLALTTIRSTEQRYGAGHPNTAQVYASTAVLAHACQRWETAYELMKAAESIWETLSPKPEDVLNNCRLNLATCLVELGRKAEATVALDKVQTAPGTPTDAVVGDLRSRIEGAAPTPPAAVAAPSQVTPPPARPPAAASPTPAQRPVQPPRQPARYEAPDDLFSFFSEDNEQGDSRSSLKDSPPFHDDDYSFEVNVGSIDEALSFPTSAQTRGQQVHTAVEVEVATPDPDMGVAGDQDRYDPAQGGQDRRQGRRFNLALNRFFDLSLVNGRGELLVIRSFLVDLSSGGLRVNTERPLPRDQSFKLTLPLSLLQEELTFPAEVIWQRELFGASYIQGLKFLEVTPAQQARIEKALAEGHLKEGGRQHFRLYRPFPIELCHADHGEWLPSYASDLSVEGLGTRLRTQLNSGDCVRLRLNLEFELPTVEVAATVAWSRNGENGVSLGLRFEEVGPVEARTIKLYIDRCLELSPD